MYETFVRRGVGIIYVLYAVALVCAWALKEHLRIVLIVCLALHFSGLIGALLKPPFADYETYPSDMGHWAANAAMFVDVLQWGALLALYDCGLADTWLYGFAVLALVGILLCLCKLAVTWKESATSNAVAPTSIADDLYPPGMYTQARYGAMLRF
jgi:hypothetical protein